MSAHQTATPFPYVAREREPNKWTRGTWDHEPDRQAWLDAVTGLHCAILRHGSLGHLCGYVAVPVGHPLHGVSYDDTVRVPHGAMERYVDIGRDIGYINALCGAFRCDEESGEAELSTVLFCHGGLSYASGESGGLWWFGFDCGHAGDISPSRFMDQFRDHDSEYRDMAYVHGQCTRLAKQIGDFAAGASFAESTP